MYSNAYSTILLKFNSKVECVVKKAYLLKVVFSVTCFDYAAIILLNIPVTPLKHYHLNVLCNSCILRVSMLFWMGNNDKRTVRLFIIFQKRRKEKSKVFREDRQ